MKSMEVDLQVTCRDLTTSESTMSMVPTYSDHNYVPPCTIKKTSCKNKIIGPTQKDYSTLEDISKRTFLKEKNVLKLKNSLTLLPIRSIDKKSALIQVMA